MGSSAQIIYTYILHHNAIELATWMNFHAEINCRDYHQNGIKIKQQNEA